MPCHPRTAGRSTSRVPRRKACDSSVLQTSTGETSGVWVRLAPSGCPTLASTFPANISSSGRHSIKGRQNLDGEDHARQLILNWRLLSNTLENLSLELAAALSVSSVLPKDRCNLRMLTPLGPRERCGPWLGPGLDRIRPATQQQFD
jgi:hypothetical protein